MARSVGPRSSTEFCWDIIGEYRKEHGDGPLRMPKVAEWARKTGRWKPQPVDPIKLFARELARAAREEYFEDPQGRRVRRMHAAKMTVIIEGEEQQLTFWDDIATARPEFMKLALQQRRTGILYDCIHHKVDTDSYNDNNTYGAQLRFEYDFTKDIAENSLPTEYPEARPEDEEESE